MTSVVEPVRTDSIRSPSVISWRSYVWPGAFPAGFLVGATARGVARIELFEELPLELRGARFEGSDGQMVSLVASGPISAILDVAERELREYFSKARDEFTMPFDLDAASRLIDVPSGVAIDRVPDRCRRSGVAFARCIWEQLAKLPSGELCSYGELGELAGVGRSAARAVGRAVGQNPLPIVIPCHRVVGASGLLTGFSGGLPLKVLLLEHEGFSLRKASDVSKMRVLEWSLEGAGHARSSARALHA
jgi:O-6-methylguanine DNA methyltransferase